MFYRISLFLIAMFATALLDSCKVSEDTGVMTAHMENGKWTEVVSADGSTPIARHEAAFVGIGDKMYLLGGRGIRPVSIYDIKKNTWSTGVVPPIELHHFQPVVYKDEIYICGAMTDKYPGETPLPDMYIYNPADDQWRKGPSIPEARRRGGAGVVIQGDKLYLLCGIKDGHRGDHKKWTDVYDFKTKTWAVLPDAPRARDHFQSVYTAGKIYNLGGRTTISSDNPFKNTIGEVDVYDVEEESWSTLHDPLPTLRAGNFVIGLARDILVFGGESFEQQLAHSEVDVLSTITNTWRVYPHLPVGRHGTGVVLYNGNLYSASGCGQKGGNPELSDMWMYSWDKN